MSNRQFWDDRTTVVSGGTSGFGLRLVVQLAKRHANVVIIGRNQERLESACRLAKESGAPSVTSFSIDVTKSFRGGLGQGNSEWSAFSNWLNDRKVDLLINAVGRSDRGTIEGLPTEDLESLFADNVFSALHMSQICLGALKQASGTIVNIASLAGLIASPRMGGYAMAKHALVAMHRQMQAEQRDTGVQFLLVCPGPIARDDSETRYEALAKLRGLDALEAKPGAGVKLKLIDPDKLACRVLDSVVRKERELVVPFKAKLLASIFPIFPRVADWLLSKYMSR